MGVASSTSYDFMNETFEQGFIVESHSMGGFVFALYAKLPSKIDIVRSGIKECCRRMVVLDEPRDTLEAIHEVKAPMKSLIIRLLKPGVYFRHRSWNHAQ
jgi:hypothetical protein